jgi:hypothetical protein
VEPDSEAAVAGHLDGDDARDQAQEAGLARELAAVAEERFERLGVAHHHELALDLDGAGEGPEAGRLLQAAGQDQLSQAGDQRRHAEGPEGRLHGTSPAPENRRQARMRNRSC